MGNAIVAAQTESQGSASVTEGKAELQKRANSLQMRVFGEAFLLLGFSGDF